MEKIDAKTVVVSPANILFAWTSPEDYDMNRVLVIEESGVGLDSYVIMEGSHCSCYDFDETRWEAIRYTRKELKALVQSWSKSGYGFETVIAEFLQEYRL